MKKSVEADKLTGDVASTIWIFTLGFVTALMVFLKLSGTQPVLWLIASLLWMDRASDTYIFLRHPAIEFDPKCCRMCYFGLLPRRATMPRGVFSGARMERTVGRAARAGRTGMRIGMRSSVFIILRLTNGQTLCSCSLPKDPGDAERFADEMERWAVGHVADAGLIRWDWLWDVMAVRAVMMVACAVVWRLGAA